MEQRDAAEAAVQEAKRLVSFARAQANAAYEVCRAQACADTTEWFYRDAGALDGWSRPQQLAGLAVALMRARACTHGAWDGGACAVTEETLMYRRCSDVGVPLRAVLAGQPGLAGAVYACFLADLAAKQAAGLHARCLAEVQRLSDAVAEAKAAAKALSDAARPPAVPRPPESDGRIGASAVLAAGAHHVQDAAGEEAVHTGEPAGPKAELPADGTGAYAARRRQAKRARVAAPTEVGCVAAYKEGYGCARAAPLTAAMETRRFTQSARPGVPPPKPLLAAMRSAGVARHAAGGAAGARGNRGAKLQRMGDHLDGATWAMFKARAAPMRFGRSRVHAWGLFAARDIAPQEFLVEYVGELIRAELADRREAAYEARGMDSSYLFRIDDFLVIDATNKGNQARYINHSCDPNAYTKIVTVDGVKHVAIIAARAIAAGQEIAYDYKFPLEPEEEPVPCACGARTCRGRLN
ncbi:hypothetical protein WJX81_002455 [Elliptochloris bilobata]|uniref:[histone H3]-lysine(4) N-trimethyltransferase n=1 Tax=Elliptochloris bilobata TaxID=381761 RepID=A0AAW1QK00_9CHLO